MRAAAKVNPTPALLAGTAPASLPKARIIEMGARSPDDVFEGMVEVERLAAERARLAKTWIDETGELVFLA